MSESRGLTLRKKAKRPPVSGPKYIASNHGRSESANSQVLKNDNLKGLQSETADLVKRRYSTRYNQLPDFSSGAPAVPGLPPNLKRYSRAGSPSRPGTANSSRPLRVDVNTFGDQSLKPEKYITDLLSNASEREIQGYQADLLRVKHRTSTDLQQNVYQNRTQFIKISKEAEKLKGEMVTLQNLMSELIGALGQASTNTSLSGLKSPELDDGGFSKRRANRSSVANLENLWNTQLQTLWKNVERSQKFLPAIPGRHIVMETGHWVELDSATWKPKRPMHLVLLNDHLLVASKKRKRIDPNSPQKGPAPTKLVAEECWPLTDIDLIDLGANLAAAGAAAVADERNIGTAINVRAAGKSFTYRHDQRDEAAKTELLITFRTTVEELRKSIRAETEQPSTPIDTLNYFASRDPASAKKTEIIESINLSREKPEVLIDVDGKQHNLRWVEGQIDDLDIDIALQRFDDAVTKVENLRKLAKGLKGNSIAQDLIKVKVDERAAKLAAALIRALVDTPAWLEPTKSNTAWLCRVGYDDRAREAYLAARTETLLHRGRQCIFEGDLHRYIFQISFVYFTIIKNTVGIYQACFPPLMMSACVKWAKEHLENFNALLVRQLSSVEKDGKAWRECMDLVWGMEEKLGEVGLDFREVVGRNLETHDKVRPSSTTSPGNTSSSSKAGSSGGSKGVTK